MNAFLVLYLYQLLKWHCSGGVGDNSPTKGYIAFGLGRLLPLDSSCTATANCTLWELLWQYTGCPVTHGRFRRNDLGRPLYVNPFIWTKNKTSCVILADTLYHVVKSPVATRVGDSGKCAQACPAVPHHRSWNHILLFGQQRKRKPRVGPYWI